MSRQLGPRQEELLFYLKHYFGGAAPSQYALYSKLSYNGRVSNQYGHAAFKRLLARGLVKVIRKGNRNEVHLVE